MERKESESRFDYIKRITQGKRDKSLDIDYTEWAILALGQEYSTDVARRMFYGIEKLIAVIEEDKIGTISDESFLLELEAKKKELAILKIQFQDQRREYSKYLRADARWQHLIEEMKDSIKELPPLEFNNYEIIKGEVEASLIISDWHLGLECSNYWNVFNYEVARKRIEKLKQKTIRYCELHKVKKLHIEILGDMINGSIHLGTRVESEEDVMSQAMRCAEIISNFVYDIANKVENVNVYTINGNHGRVTANKHDSIEVENFERLVPWYMKTRLKDSKNIKICENQYDDTISHYMIGNKHIFSAHGHLDKIGNVINDYSRMFKVVADEVHLGHFHSYYEKDEHNSTVVVNGSLSGVDTYAKSIRKTGTPTQILKIYGDDVCTYKITL